MQLMGSPGRGLLHKVRKDCSEVRQNRCMRCSKYDSESIQNSRLSDLIGALRVVSFFMPSDVGRSRDDRGGEKGL